MRKSGKSDKEIQACWDAKARMQERVEARKLGYAGWLVTHPDFHLARNRFRQQWQSNINKLGAFPALPRSFFGEQPPELQQRDHPFDMAYTSLYQDWGLHSLATWELPIPMRPEMAEPSFYHLPAVSSAGITFFVPWYMLRDKNLKLRELAEHKLILMSQPHLEDWLTGKPKDWGHERFAVMLKLYIYIELCLEVRYSNRMKRKRGKLDYAFGRFLCDDPSILDADIREAENIRKIRQKMNERLKKCKTT